MNKPETIIEGKNYLRENFSTGVGCPCCGQFVKQYKRKLNSNQAWCLISLVKLYRQEARFFHINEIGTPAGGGDFAKLRYWKLIEEKKHKGSDKRTSGFWIPTEFGIDFVNDMVRVYKHVFIFNGKVTGWSDESTNIIEALGDKFNYIELMQNK